MKDTLKQVFSLVLPSAVLIVVPTWIEPRFATASSLQQPICGFQFFGGPVLVLAGLLVMAQTVATFIRIGKGTLAPWSPTRKLVVSGLYAHVRNPMILGVVVALIGEALVISSLRILVWAALVFVINTFYFIFSEEPGLEKRFGEAYREYKENVPRWIPRWKAWRPQGIDHLTCAPD